MNTLITLIASIWLGSAPISTSTPISSPESKEVEKTPIVDEASENIGQLSISDIIYTEGEKAGLSTKEMHRFYDIAMCESHLNPRAVSHTQDYGLYQIHIPVWKVDMNKIFDPQYNTWYAMNIIYPKQGFNAWVCNKIID